MPNKTVSTLISGTSDDAVFDRASVSRVRENGTLVDSLSTLGGKIERFGLLHRIGRGIAMVDSIAAAKAANVRLSQGDAGALHGFATGEAKHGLALGLAFDLGADDETLIRMASTVRKSRKEYAPEKDYVIAASKGKETWNVATLIRLMDEADAFVAPEKADRSDFDKAMAALSNFSNIVGKEDSDGTVAANAGAILAALMDAGVLVEGVAAAAQVSAAA